MTLNETIFSQWGRTPIDPYCHRRSQQKAEGQLVFQSDFPNTYI